MILCTGVRGSGEMAGAGEESYFNVTPTLLWQKLNHLYYHETQVDNLP